MTLRQILFVVYQLMPACILRPHMKIKKGRTTIYFFADLLPNGRGKEQVLVAICLLQHSQLPSGIAVSKAFEHLPWITGDK